MEGKICSSTQTCRNVNREWTLHIERHPWAKEREPWWQGLVPPMMRGPRTQPHIGPIVSEFQFVYIIQHSINVMTMVESVQLKGEQTYGWDNGPIDYEDNIYNVSYQSGGQYVHRQEYKECCYRQGSGPNVICVYDVTTLKGDNLPLLWYLGNEFWRNQRTQRNQLSVLWNFFVPKPIPIPWD